MPFGVGSQTQLTWVPEVTWGSTPVAPAMAVLPVSSAKMRRTTKNADVAALRGDRQVDDYYFAARSATLEIDYVVRNTVFDELVAMALMSSWSGGFITPGVTRKSATFELMHPDIGVYEVITGAVSKSLTFSLGEDGYLRAKQTFVGQSYSIAGTSLDASPDAANLANIARATNPSVHGVTIGGVVWPNVTAFEVTIENGLSEVWPVNNRVPMDVGTGRVTVTGSITALLENSTRISQFLSEASIGIGFNVARGAGALTGFCSASKLTSSEEPVDGESFVFQKFGFQSLAPTGTNSLLLIAS